MGSGVSKQAQFVIGLDFTRVRQLARAADFFHNYPRIIPTHLGRRSDIFSLTSEYKRSVSFLSLPYLLTGVILVLGAIIFNLYRYFRKGISPGADDTKDSDPGQRDGTAKAYLLFSAFLHVCILLLIGMAFGANVTIREAIESALHAISTLQDKVTLELLVPSTFFAQWSDSVRATVSAQKRTLAEEELAFDLLSINNEAFYNTKKGSDKVVQGLVQLSSYLKNLSASMFGGITSILVLFVIGSFLMYFGDVAPPRAHKTRMVMIILFALPLGAAWGLVAFSTVVGVLTGDFCYSLEQYHRIVAGQRGSLATGSSPKLPEFNMFLQNDLQCPTHTSFKNDIKHMNIFFDQAANQSQFNFGMARFDKKHDHQVWAEAMRWAEDSLSEYGDCKAHAVFGGNLAYHMCGDHNASAVSAMALLWLAAAGLSMLFGVLVYIFSLGQPPSEFATGYEMLQLYGAPKLIRAFGDVGNALTRQATFHRIASSLDLPRESKNQPRLQVTKSVAEAFTDCAVRVEDQYLVHVKSSRRSSVLSPGSMFSRRSSRMRSNADIEQPESPRLLTESGSGTLKPVVDTDSD